MPAASAFFDPSFFLSARKTTFFSAFVDPATTTSRVVARRHAFLPGTSHVTVGFFTTAIFAPRKFVFGRTFAPIVLTFFASWLSDALTTTLFFFFAAVIFGAFDGSAKSTSPVVGSYADAPTRTFEL